MSLGLAGLCLAGAALELDAVSLGQWMLSRPIVGGPLLGLLAGDARIGLVMGILIELLILEDLPIGGAIPINGPVAAAAATILASGPGGLEPGLALPAGYLLGLLYRPLDVRLRARRAALPRLVEARLAEGAEPGAGRLIAGAAAAQFAATFLFLLAATFSGRFLGNWLWPAVPEALREGFETAFRLTPLLGLASLMFVTRPQ